MQTGKIIYKEYENNIKTNEIKRLCKIKEEKTYTTFDFILEKKDKMRLLVYKNNDIITIIRDGSINYEVTHVPKTKSIFDVNFGYGSLKNSFKQELTTTNITLTSEEELYNIEINYNRNGDNVKGVYKVEVKRNG